MCREIRLLERPRVVVGEAVEPDDLGPAIEECAAEVRPDEARGAGDECLHANTWRIRSGRRHGPAVDIDGGMHGRAGRGERGVFAADHFVLNCMRTGDSICAFRPHVELVVVARRFGGRRSGLR